MKGEVRGEVFRRVAVGADAVAIASVVGVAWAQVDAPLDPAHNVALPCEAVSTPGLVPRSAKNISHVANVCGFVGTDVEFQSRNANDGVHDYAFLGTMGGGLLSTSPLPRVRARPVGTPIPAGRTTSRCAAISPSSASIRSEARIPRAPSVSKAKERAAVSISCA